MTLRFLALVYCVLPVSLHATPTYPEANIPELSTLLEKAGANAPALVAQALARDESLARLDVARAAYYPRVDIQSNAGFRQTRYEVDGVESENSAGANFYAVIRRPLYHWGAIAARIKQARLDQSNEDLQRVLILRQIKRGIRANYLNLIVNQATLKSLRERRASAETEISRLRGDADAGTVSTLDAAQLQLNQQQTLIDIDYHESQQERIRASFQREIGWDAPLTLDQALPSPDANALLAWIEQARASGSLVWVGDHAEVLRRQNLVARERAELTWITSRQRPLVNISASAVRDQRNVAGENNADAMTYFAGLEISWNVFDGFETSARKREASARMRRYERQLEAYCAELAAQAGDVLNTISLQLRQLQLNDTRASIATQSLTSAESDAAEGRLSAQALRERRIGAQETELNALRTRVTLLLALNDYLDLTLPVAVDLPAQ